MVRRTRKSWVTLTTGMAAVALVATGCSSGSDSTSDAATEETGTEPVTLSVATFNEFGYEDLITEYEELNPNVTIEQKKAATSGEAKDNLNTRLAAGSGASDIEAVEVDWLPELMQYPDKFVDLNDPSVEGRWLGARVLDDHGAEAIGTRAELERSDGRSLWRRVRTDGSFATSNDPRMLFGLDTSGAPRRLRLLWVGGGASEWRDLPFDRYVTLMRPTGRTP